MSLLSRIYDMQVINNIHDFLVGIIFIGLAIFPVFTEFMVLYIFRVFIWVCSGTTG